MLYDAYKNRIQKLAVVRRWMWKFRVPIIVVLSVLAASLTAFLCVRGNVTTNVSLVSQEIYYGDDYELNEAKALLSHVKGYEYSAADSGEWSKKKPVAPGNYYVRAVTAGGLGKKKGKSVPFTILPRPVDISVLSNVDTEDAYGIAYGDSPKVEAALAYDDALVLSALSFTLADPAQLTTEVALNEASIAVRNAAGENTTDYYTFTAHKALVAFDRRAITITPQAMQSVYNGSVQTFENVPDEATRNALAYNTQVSFATEITDENGRVVEGPVNAGTYTVRILPDSVRLHIGNTDVTHCYTTPVLGQTAFTVARRPLTVTTADAEKYYDGSPLRAPAFTHGETVQGHTVSLRHDAVICERTAAGSAPNAFAAADFAISDRVSDVTRNYAVSVTCGTLTVHKRTITLTTADDTREFDGSAWSNTNASVSCSVQDALGNSLPIGQKLLVVWAASVTDVRDSKAHNNAVTFRIADEYDVEDFTANYNIQYEYGTLTVTPCPIRLTADTVRYTYTGEDYANIVATAAYAGDLSGAGVACIYECRIADPNKIVWQRNAGYLPDPYVAADYGIYDSNGTYIGDNYTVVGLYSGGVSVMSREVYIEAVANDKTYDGTSNADIAWNYVQGSNTFVQGEIPDIGWNFESDPINVGRYRIVSVDLSGNKNAAFRPENYTIYYSGGNWLQIIARPVTVTTATVLREYDGNTLFDRSFQYEGLADGHNIALSDAVSDIGITDRGNRTNDYKKTDYIITDAAGIPVTDNYAIVMQWGTLTVTPRNICVYTNDNIWYYDGGGHYDSGYKKITHQTYNELTGAWQDDALPALIGDDPLTVSSYNSVVEAKDYSNIVDYSVSDNYALRYAYGMLTVRPLPITIAIADKTETYDGGAHTYGARSDWNVVSENRLVGDQIPAFRWQYNGATDAPVNAGSYTVSATCVNNAATGFSTSNYEIEIQTGTLTIRRLSVTVIINDGHKIYDGKPYDRAADTSAWVNGYDWRYADGSAHFVEIPAFVWNYGITPPTDAGENYVIAEHTVTGGDNYDITVINGALTIGKRIVYLCPTATKTYDGTEDFTVASQNIYAQGLSDEYKFVNGFMPERLYWKYVYAGEHKNVDTYDIALDTDKTQTVWDNYILAADATNGTLTVLCREVFIRPKDDTTSKTYDGTAYDSKAVFGNDDWEYNGDTRFVTGEIPVFVWAYVNDDFGYSLSPVHAGTYTVSYYSVLGEGGFSANNYTIVCDTGTLVIAPRKVEIAIHVEKASGYAGNGHKEYDGMAYYHMYTENPWMYTGISANDALHAFLEAPVLLYSYNGDLVSLPLHAGTYTIGATLATGAGFYDTDYSLAVTPATFIVDKRAVTVKITDGNKVYDGERYEHPADGWEYAGDGKMFIEEPTFAWKYDGSVVLPIDAGIYIISYQAVTDGNDNGFMASNYTLSVASGTLTIEKRTVILCPTATKMYDGTEDFTVSSENLYASDVSEKNKFVGDFMPQLYFKFADACEHEESTHKNAGAHFIVLDTDKTQTVLDNYILAADRRGGALTVLPRPVEIQINDGSKEYDGQAYARKDDASAWINGYDWRYVNGSLPFIENEVPTFVWLYNGVGEAPVIVAWGGHVISLGFALNGNGNGFIESNYEIYAHNGTLTIHKREVKIVIRNGEKTYDGKPYDRIKDTFAYIDGKDWTYAVGSKEFIEMPAFAWSYTDGMNVFDSFAPPVNAGEYVIGIHSVMAADNNEFMESNYSISAQTGSLTIHRLAVTVQRASDTKVYDGAALRGDTALCDALAVSSHYLVADETTVTTLVHVGKEDIATEFFVFDYTTGENVTANYDIRYTAATLAITQRNITVRVVGEATYRVDDLTVEVVAAADSAYPLLPDEIPYIADPQRDITLDRPYGNAGKYDITFVQWSDSGDFVQSNYSIALSADSVITVKPRTVYITADGEKAYDGTDALADDAITIDYADASVDTAHMQFAEGETPAFFWQLSAPPIHVQEGGYDIVLALPQKTETFDPDNYDIVYIQGTFTVVPRSVRIVVNDVVKIYDAQPYRGETSVWQYAAGSNAIVDGESPLISWVYTQAQANVDAPTNAGEYTVYCDMGSSDSFRLTDYALQIEAGVLTIEKRTVAVCAASETATYGDIAADALTKRMVHFVNPADALVYADSDRPVLQWKAEGKDGAVFPHAGDYDVTLDETKEYDNFVFVNGGEKGMLSITRREVVIVPDIKTPERVFDGTEYFDVSPSCAAGTSFAFDEVPVAAWEWRNGAGEVVTKHSDPGTYTVAYKAISAENDVNLFDPADYRIAAGSAPTVTIYGDIGLRTRQTYGKYNAAAYVSVDGIIDGFVTDGKATDKTIAGFTFQAKVAKIVRERDALGNADGAAYQKAVNAGTYTVYFQAVTFDPLHDYSGEALADLGLSIVNDPHYVSGINGVCYAYTFTIAPVEIDVRPQETSLQYPGGRYVSLGTDAGRAVYAVIWGDGLVQGHTFVIEQTERVDITKETEKNIGVTKYRITDGNGADVEEYDNNYKVRCVRNGDTSDAYRAKLTVQKISVTVVRKPMGGSIEDRTIVYTGAKVIDANAFADNELVYCTDGAQYLQSYGHALQAYGEVQFLLQLIAPSPGDKSAWLKVNIVGDDGEGAYVATKAYAITYKYAYEVDDGVSADIADYSIRVCKADVRIVRTADGGVTVAWGANAPQGVDISTTADGGYTLCGNHVLYVSVTADGISYEVRDAKSGAATEQDKYYEFTVTAS